MSAGWFIAIVAMVCALVVGFVAWRTVGPPARRRREHEARIEASRQEVIRARHAGAKDLPLATDDSRRAHEALGLGHLVRRPPGRPRTAGPSRRDTGPWADGGPLGNPAVNPALYGPGDGRTPGKSVHPPLDGDPVSGPAVGGWPSSGSSGSDHGGSSGGSSGGGYSGGSDSGGSSSSGGDSGGGGW